MLFLGSDSGLSSAYHRIFNTFYKESLHLTRSGGILKQNNLTGLIDFFHSNKALLCGHSFDEDITAVVRQSLGTSLTKNNCMESKRQEGQFW